jgi:hypothetical protein
MTKTDDTVKTATGNRGCDQTAGFAPTSSADSVKRRRMISWLFRTACRCRPGRKKDAITAKAERNLCACQGDLKPRVHRSLSRVG